MEYVDLLGMKGFLLRILRRIDEPHWKKWHNGVAGDANTCKGLTRLAEDVCQSVSSYSAQKDGEIEQLRHRLSVLSKGAYGLNKSDT